MNEVYVFALCLAWSSVVNYTIPYLIFFFLCAVIPKYIGLMEETLGMGPYGCAYTLNVYHNVM